MPKFPFTNYHELNLDWILKKVEALFTASEENARTIRTYDNRLTYAELTATNAGNTATAAQQLADAAAANADNALSVAGTADAKADSALTAATDASSAASGALTVAQEAQQTAGAAVATANDAASTASGLESLANTANQNATAAVETAGTANQNATAAQTAAQTADQKAVAAQQTANSAQSAAATNAGNISTLQTDITNLNRQISNLESDLNYARINVALTAYFKKFLIYGCSHTGNGTYNLTDLPRTTLAKRICLPFSITINALNGCNIAMQYFNQNGDLLSASNWLTNITIPENTYFQFIVNSADTTIDLFEVLVNETINSVDIIDNALSLYDASINIPPMIKQHMTPLTILNVSAQSFDYDEENNRILCYGSSSSFYAVDLITGIRTTLSNQMDCGHGNSACYNKNNKRFYVFGWDSPYITPINIASTPVKEPEINTGLTGYLAGAIDFDNNIAYIFQRNTNPNTYAYYNFIAFDLTNNTIISTSKTSIQMIAVQDCKFKDGFIFANWGLTDSHFSCFDTTGKCVYSYKNIIQSYEEPEGLAFVNESIFISTYKGNKLQTFKLINSGKLFT